MTDDRTEILICEDQRTAVFATEQDAERFVATGDDRDVEEYRDISPEQIVEAERDALAR